MDLTELAHWRYRLKALVGDLAECNEVMARVHLLPQLVGDELAISEGQKLSDEREFTKWLLEEAKYMSELGALQVDRLEHPAG